MAAKTMRKFTSKLRSFKDSHAALRAEDGQSGMEPEEAQQKKEPAEDREEDLEVEIQAHRHVEGGISGRAAST
jgi:hypothetical protein